MKRLASKEFDTLRAECSQSNKGLLDFMMTVAAHAGPAVEPPTFEVRGNKGLGVTYWTNGRRFCRFDPKPQADHVWAMVPDADRSALGASGSVSPRSDGPWVTVKNLRGAVQLVPLILQSYNSAWKA